MKLKIEIEMDNAAFEHNGSEVARILCALAQRYDGETLFAQDRQPVIDANGNNVGEAKVTR